MEKNKRSKIIGLSIGILIVLIIVVSSTYAYWQITRTQETPNDIVAACLDLNLEDKSAAIDLDSAWPISDEEANSLTGYTFTVTNNCDQEVNYIVGLNRVEESNYLQDSSIKVRLDEQSSHVYEELSDVEYADSNNTGYTSRVSKQVSVETISANGTNEHTIRVWVSEDAPVTEQSKTFEGQVFITGGQGIEAPECFTIANNGALIGYDYTCGTEVKVPAEINGIAVKEIHGAFQVNALDIYWMSNKETSDELEVYYIKDETKVGQVIESLKEEYCDESTTCTLEDIATKGIIIITSEQEYNKFDWNSYMMDGPYNFDFTEEDGIIDYVINTHNVTSLDLSEAIYLESIGGSALLGSYESDIMVDESCYYVAKGAYYACGGVLEKVIFPQNGLLTTIGASAFSNNQLTELILPNGIKSIYSNAFSDNNLKKIIIPSSVETISDGAFISNQITTLIFEGTIDNSSKLTTIEYEAFSNNDITDTLVFPNSVTTIGNRAFVDNSNLTEVVIKNTEGNVTLGETAFPSAVNITYNPNYTE